jgi:hypothetical protein
MRLVLTILGLLMILLGLVWAAQGSGLFPYPAQSFMIDNRPWIGWGLLLAAAGALVLWLARRSPSR